MAFKKNYQIEVKRFQPAKYIIFNQTFFYREANDHKIEALINMMIFG